MDTKAKFSTVDAAQRLLHSMETAIDSLIEEIKKPVDPDITGSARKAELQSIKQSVTDCRELIQERQRLEEMINSLRNNDEVEQDKDYRSGWAEKKVKS